MKFTTKQYKSCRFVQKFESAIPPIIYFASFRRLKKKQFYYSTRILPQRRPKKNVYSCWTKPSRRLKSNYNETWCTSGQKKSRVTPLSVRKLKKERKLAKKKSEPLMRLCSCNAVLVWQMIFRCWRTPLVFLNCFDVFVASPPPFTFSIFTILPPFFPLTPFEIPWLPKKLLAVGFSFSFFFCTCVCVSQSISLFGSVAFLYLVLFCSFFSSRVSQRENTPSDEWKRKHL